MAEPGSGQTLGALVRHIRAILTEAGIPDAALEARLIVEHFTRTSRSDAVLDPERAVEAEAADGSIAAAARRKAGEPVYRILGAREFHGLELKLSPGTLEPRQETEVLVDLALGHVRAAVERNGSCRILDLGTGTGAIALALLKEEPLAEAVGVDLSEDALATAAANADMTGNGARFRAVRSDWFSRVEGEFQIIVSNPPYIRSMDMTDLQREVRDHDPHLALDGGADGLDAYRAIARGAAQHLAEDGMIAIEIGHGQLDGVTAIFKAAGYRLVQCIRDLAGHDRALAFGR